jgi:hypothetical protein
MERELREVRDWANKIALDQGLPRSHEYSKLVETIDAILAGYGATVVTGKPAAAKGIQRSSQRGFLRLVDASYLKSVPARDTGRERNPV